MLACGASAMEQFGQLSREKSSYAEHREDACNLKCNFKLTNIGYIKLLYHASKKRDCHVLKLRLFCGTRGWEELGLAPGGEGSRARPETVGSVGQPPPANVGGRVSEVRMMQPSSVKTDAGIFGLDGSREGATKEPG